MDSRTLNEKIQIAKRKVNLFTALSFVIHYISGAFGFFAFISIFMKSMARKTDKATDTNSVLYYLVLGIIFLIVSVCLIFFNYLKYKRVKEFSAVSFVRSVIVDSIFDLLTAYPLSEIYIWGINNSIFGHSSKLNNILLSLGFFVAFIIWNGLVFVPKLLTRRRILRELQKWCDDNNTSYEKKTKI